MSKEHTSSRPGGSAGFRVLSVALLAVGAALVVSAVLMAPHSDPFGVAIFSAIAVGILSGGLVLAHRSGLFTGWSWSGRAWSELLTPGGPVRSPFEWIRVAIAAALGSVVVFVLAIGTLAAIGWPDDASSVRAFIGSEASFEQVLIGAVGFLALLLGLTALLCAVFAVVALAVGVIGLGLRSGASSMSLRDWVSMDKRV